MSDVHKCIYALLSFSSGSFLIVLPFSSTRGASPPIANSRPPPSNSLPKLPEIHYEKTKVGRGGPKQRGRGCSTVFNFS